MARILIEFSRLMNFTVIDIEMENNNLTSDLTSEACQRCSSLGDLGMLQPAYGRHGHGKLRMGIGVEEGVLLQPGTSRCRIIFPPTKSTPQPRVLSNRSSRFCI